MGRRKRDVKHHRVVRDEACLLCGRPAGEACVNYKRKPKEPCWWWVREGTAAARNDKDERRSRGELFGPEFSTKRKCRGE